MISETEMAIVRLSTRILAYVLEIDGDALKPEERSRLMTLLGKFVSSAEMSGKELQAIVADALDEGAKSSLDELLSGDVLAALRPGQRYALYINACDAVLVDGVTSFGESEAIDDLRRLLKIDPQEAGVIGEVLKLMNDKDVLTKSGHPTNDHAYSLKRYLLTGAG